MFDILKFFLSSLNFEILAHDRGLQYTACYVRRLIVTVCLPGTAVEQIIQLRSTCLPTLLRALIPSSVNGVIHNYYSTFCCSMKVTYGRLLSMWKNVSEW